MNEKRSFIEFMQQYDKTHRNHKMKPFLRHFSSPTSVVSSEETRLLTEYIDQSNVFIISKYSEKNRKSLMLRKFFKMKRNQEVVVLSFSKGEKLLSKGKVTAIGRDFVMITNLKNRIWIPYSAIDSANIPYGAPTYSNTHQHFYYDNDLRIKLLTQFGKTVSRRNELIQQFFEESLQTNINSWKGTWVRVRTKQHTFLGKITKTTKTHLSLTIFNTEEVLLEHIEYISTVRMFQVLRKIMMK